MRESRLIRACRWVIDAGSRFAPAWRREDWRQEWLAELHYRASRLDAHGRLTHPAEIRLLCRCLGSVFHLLFLWKHHWGLDMLTQDIRFAVRMLRRRPTFSTVAILTLALGIGATTAMFSAVRAVLLKPLPYPQPDRLVRLYGRDTRPGQESIGNLSVPDVMDIQRQARSFAAVGAHNYGGYFTLTGRGEPERLGRLLVTSGYFRVLGVQPLLGRLFRPDEDRPDPPSVVLASYGFWMRRFGGDPDIIGKSVVLSGFPATIVGVLPSGFAHPDPHIEATPEIFALLDPDEKASSRDGRYVRAVARLNDTQSIEGAASEVDAIASRLTSQYPTSNTGRTVVLKPLHVAVAGESVSPLLLLQGATLAVLLIACVNLANLLLGAASGRTGELTVRMALGASRVRIVRQLLTESLVLASAGGALGILLAWWVTTWLGTAAGSMLLPQQQLTLDGTVLTVALLVSVAAGLTFGLMPALQVSRTTTANSAQSRRLTADRMQTRLRSILIAAEAMLSVVLLVGAVLLLRSFRQLTDVDPGFRSSHILSFQAAIQPAAYPDGNPGIFYERVYDRLRALPGVTSVGGVNILPLSGNFSCDGMQVEGREVPPAQAPCAEVRSASPGYFNTMGIPLVRGRLFTEADNEHAPRVILINEALARRFFPGEDPIGRRIIYTSRNQNDPRLIVGIVGDVHHFGVDTPPPPEFYTPARQPPTYGLMSIVVQTAEESRALMPAVRSIIREISPDVPVYNVRTLDSVLSESMATPRFRTVLLALFAALAVLLAAVGTYGVIALAVSQRGREMAVRVALGATMPDIVRFVVVGGVRPVLVGAAAGLAAGSVEGRMIASMLFRVTPGDPSTFAIAAAVVIVAGLVATWIPARRACRVDAADALRQ